MRKLGLLALVVTGLVPTHLAGQAVTPEQSIGRWEGQMVLDSTSAESKWHYELTFRPDSTLVLLRAGELGGVQIRHHRLERWRVGAAGKLESQVVGTIIENDTALTAPVVLPWLGWWEGHKAVLEDDRMLIYVAR